MSESVTPRTYLGTRGDAGWTRCSRSDCQREHAEHHGGELAMLCPVTPETLTDEQIRAFRASLRPENPYQRRKFKSTIEACNYAMERRPFGHIGAERWDRNRDRLCYAINARLAK